MNYQKQITNDKLSNFCVALTLKEYIYFCLILKFDFDLVLGFMIDAVFQSLIFFTQIILFLFWLCWGVWETPNIVNSLTGKLSMYHLPTYFLQYPSNNISILMLLSLRCLRHSEWRERFDTTTPPRLINNHRPPSCVRRTEYFYCRTIDFSFIFSRGLLCKFSKKKCLARNFPIEIQCILKQVARTPSP